MSSKQRALIIGCIAVAALVAIIATALHFTKNMPSLAGGLTVTMVKGVTAIQPPVLPDISGITIEAIAAKAPSYVEPPPAPEPVVAPAATEKSGDAPVVPVVKVEPPKPDIVVTSMFGILSLREFVKKDGRVQNQRLSRMSVQPRAIVVQKGVYDFPHLYAAVEALATEALPMKDLIVKKDNTYLFRVPLLVGPGATLTINGEDGTEILLSRERGTFIANGGDLYMIKVKVTGWDETTNKPSYFKDALSFRPFIVSWGGGQLNMAGCKVASLGYRKGKSYGLTYSTCRECLEADSTIPRPTGVLVGNEFHDMYYGFYSYEADDVAIVGNKYVDNAVYAIDPHDRSRRLIIARNETYGSKKKHGIIISREVDDSWIFENHSHHNHGSGIMIDRTSSRNIIANNLSEYNEQDGLTFFESQDNITWGNRFVNNKRNGVKIRNSWDIKMYNDTIVNNGGAPIDIYTADISKQETRDFVMDPFTQRASAEISGATIKSNPSGVFKVGEVEGLRLSNMFITPAIAPLFVGNTIPGNMNLIKELSAQQHSLHITPSSAKPPQGKVIGTINPVE